MLQLHFQVYGTGQPLILLHGLFGSLENWHSINLRLSSEYRVFAVDQRNHGRSPHHAEMNYPLMAVDVLKLMQAQGIPSAHVVGHSMGGKAAMELALSHPEAVQRLVVVDITPKTYPPQHAHIFNALLALDLARYESRKQIETALAPDIPELAVRQFLLKNLGRSGEGMFQWRIGLQEIHQNYSRLNAGITAGRVFPGPTLFLTGAQSDYVRPQDIESARDLFPDAELRTIPRAGHWVHAEAPNEFVQSVAGFLRHPLPADGSE